MIGEQNVFNQPIESYLEAYENIRKITIVQGDDYPTGCLFCYPCFKQGFMKIAIDLNKQQVLDSDAKAI